MNIRSAVLGRHGSGLRPHGQRGVVLMITLIVLAALMLAAVALLRSVDTGNLVTGNMALKGAALNAGDKGVESALRWIVTNRSTLNVDNAAQGYWSTVPSSDPDWTTSAAWTNALCIDSCVADAAGNKNYYVIHRMCSATGAPDSSHCAVVTSNSAGSSSVAGSTPFTGQRVYYRVTVRTVGPRSTVSVVQSMIVGG
jgi:Tfp pilus assembly protein PilX